MEDFGKVQVRSDRGGFRTKEVFEVRMPKFKAIDVVLSGNDAIRATLTAGKLVYGSPSKFNLPITNESVDVITEGVKVLFLLGSVDDELKVKLKRRQRQSPLHRRVVFTYVLL